MSDDEFLARALRAAKKAARQAGAAAGDPVVLCRSRRICLLFREIATIARIAPADEASLAAEARELAVTRYLAERKAPVVGPSDAAASSLFVDEGMAVTLWPYVEHSTADYDDRVAVARAARALRQVHEALADYAGELPSYSDRIEECAGLLQRADALPVLGDDDRLFLLRTYERLSRALAEFTIRLSPIHGDAHMGNVFFTPNGPLWTDFETACLGPYEWDAAATPHLAAFPALNPDLYKVLSKLRSLCVAVWCSALAADPDKRAAAEHHLALLKADDGSSASES